MVMARLDEERQKELEPQRIAHAKKCLQEKGYEITFQDERELQFIHEGETVNFFPYSGWHTGKSIKDGRGLRKLLKQL